MKFLYKRLILVILCVFVVFLLLQIPKIVLVNKAINDFIASDNMSVAAQKEGSYVSTRFYKNGIVIHSHQDNAAEVYEYYLFSQDNEYVDYYHGDSRKQDGNEFVDWVYEYAELEQESVLQKEDSVLYQAREAFMINPFSFKISVTRINGNWLLRLGRSFDKDRLGGYLFYFDIKTGQLVQLYYYRSGGDDYKKWIYQYYDDEHNTLIIPQYIPNSCVPFVEEDDGINWDNLDIIGIEQIPTVNY